MKPVSWARSPLRRLGSVAWGSFWSVPIAMLVATLVIVAVLLWLDAVGASTALANQGWPLAIPGKAAQELASSLVAVHVALIALYFSITLLVLTLAGGTLGVRLIDIWIARRLTRVTLGLLLSGLAASLIALLAVDPDASGAHVARLTLVVLTAATILLLGWLAMALHDLARTIHIDTVIAYLRRRIVDDASAFSDVVAPPVDTDWTRGAVIAAPRSGFVESIDFGSLVRAAQRLDVRIEVSALPGDYRIKGEALGRIVGARTDDEHLTKHFALSGYRSASEGSSFTVRLLVEIAARALSPAVNDFYTALACVDALGSAMTAQGQLSQDAPWLGDEAGTARVHVAIEPFEDLFDAPLKALRHAAAQYPVVAIHLILMLCRARQLVGDPTVRDLLAAHAEATRAHGVQVAVFAPDGQAIDRAIAAPLPATD
ncbi:DUF2254 family protein [Sphingomonas oligophenolica]|uniref:DUF2254 domain-containing protein n=1 Tax=Sphingomonas oligophenolica TaxID=301154 RepID=A0A502CLE4_9SPHN|nr:DUF2254 family protein [Sphingomonas oligophenolica]TPG13653.1 DUF2254 domain-containing protein [Sphingomonas oligophenolica]